MSGLDFSRTPLTELAAIAAASMAELARRAGAVAPVQLELLPSPEPIDPATVDFGEVMPSGKPRFVFVKEAAITLRMSEDALIARSKRDGIGFQIGGPGGKWMIDMKRVSSRA